MQIAIPVQVVDATIVSTNLPETDHAEFDVAITYATGDNVISTITHRIYESLVDSNLGNDPTLTTSSAQWLDTGATNRWKPFDQYITDQAINTLGDTIEYTFGNLTAPVNAVVCFGLSGESVSLVVTDPTDGVVYSEIVSLVDTSLIVDAYTYCFEPSRVRSEAVFASIPPYLTASFDLVVSDSVNDPQVGQIVLGQNYDIGLTRYGSTVGIEDYSLKDRDDFGNAIIVERPFAKLVDYDVAIPTEYTRRTAILLEGIRATPAVFFAGLNTDQYGTTVYGYYRSWRVTLAGPVYSFATLEIEGLT